MTRKKPLRPSRNQRAPGKRFTPAATLRGFHQSAERVLSESEVYILNFGGGEMIECPPQRPHTSRPREYSIQLISPRTFKISIWRAPQWGHHRCAEMSPQNGHSAYRRGDPTPSPPHQRHESIFEARQVMFVLSF